MMDIDPQRSEYFSSYEDLEVHKLMLEDETRTQAYKSAILNNKQFFKDKVVLDVGCGTGILSVFCAQAGAKKVYAVEASSIANLAKEIVKENKFEHVIEVIQSRVEDLMLPDNIKVDTIVSEWMGFYLLHEGMLDSVLAARDKFLKEGGEIFPESAVVYVAPCSMPSLYYKWNKVHGVAMSSFAKQLRNGMHNKPQIQSIYPEDLLGHEVAMCWINLKEDSVEDLNSFSIQHVVGASRNGAYQGLCIWFECMFPYQKQGGEGRTILGTGPFSLPTHWKQTVLVLPEEHEVDKGEAIAFRLDMTRDKDNCRRYNLQFSMLDPDEVEHPLPCSCDMTKCILIKTYMLEHPHENVEQRATRSTENNVLEDDPIDDNE